MRAPTIKPVPESPFRGIESFRFIDQQIFAARKNETWELLSNLMIYRAVLLYGDSGSGKSSLVNAGLIPQALDEGFVPNVLRVQPRRGKEIKVERVPTEAAGRPPYLPSTFTTEDTSLTFECSIRDVDRHLQQLKRSQSNGPHAHIVEESRSPTPLLVFDQFEEFITLFEEASRGGTTEQATALQEEALEAQREILKTLSSLIHDETLPIKILFVFREDYLAKLNTLFEDCPNLLDQYIRLLPPRSEVLEEIIRAPFEKQELRDAFERQQPGQKSSELTKLAEKIATELAHHGESGINLSELQIVCRKLWESDKPAALFKEKSIQDLIEEYWADALKKFPDELNKPAVALLGHMITSSNTRNIVSEDDLLAREKENFTEKQLRAALDALLQSRLVRREPRYKVYFYEIVSEYLVRWIQRLKAGRFAELERIKVRHNLELAKGQTRVLQKWRRGLAFAAVASVLLLVASVSFLYFSVRAKQAEAGERVRAQTSLRVAEQERDKNRRIIQLLQDLTSISPDERLRAIEAIHNLANEQGIPRELGNALLALVVTDRDSRVVKAAKELIPQVVQSNPELGQVRASIQIESQDNQNQKTRADRIKVALTAKGIVVADYDYGGLAPSTNQLKYCIPEGKSAPDQLLELIRSVDDGKWEMTAIPGCEKSVGPLPSYYEILFSSDRRTALRELLAVERQWKNAKASGNLAVLRGVFADTFTNTDNEGRTYNKSDWIAQFRGGDPSLKGWKITEPKLVSYGGNTATITFTITTDSEQLKDTDTFVKRDGRWQVIGSQSTPLH
jgi:hypothetical protein